MDSIANGMLGEGSREPFVPSEIRRGFDASWSGEPTEWRRVAGLAHACDVRMAHHEEPQVASHLLASIPHGTFVECFHPDRDPIWWNLVANRPPLSDGAIELTEAPGLGWELDEDFIDAHRVRR